MFNALKIDFIKKIIAFKTKVECLLSIEIKTLWVFFFWFPEWIISEITTC